jgi:heat shock protein HtpX
MMSKFYNNIKTALLLGVLTAVILGIGSIWGSQGLIFALIIAAGMNFVAYFFSAKIAIMSMRAYEVGPDHLLYKIVAELARRANLPMPRVYVSPLEAPNAFATGRNPRNAAVCATEGLLQMLEPHEIAGVMAHELAHVKHRDILIQSVAVTLAAAITVLVRIQFYSRNRDSNPLFGLLAIILAPLAAMLIQAAISRSREFNADKGGAEICGDPMALSTALEKIHALNHRIPMDVNPAFNSMFIAEPMGTLKGIVNLFQTHPPLEKRLVNLIGKPGTGLIPHDE